MRLGETDHCRNEVGDRRTSGVPRARSIVLGSSVAPLRLMEIPCRTRTPSDPVCHLAIAPERKELLCSPTRPPVQTDLRRSERLSFAPHSAASTSGSYAPALAAVTDSGMAERKTLSGS